LQPRQEDERVSAASHQEFLVIEFNHGEEAPLAQRQRLAYAQAPRPAGLCRLPNPMPKILNHASPGDLRGGRLDGKMNFHDFCSLLACRRQATCTHRNSNPLTDGRNSVKQTPLLAKEGTKGWLRVSILTPGS
jgi:hypothetical protein